MFLQPFVIDLKTLLLITHLFWQISPCSEKILEVFLLPFLLIAQRVIWNNLPAALSPYRSYRIYSVAPSVISNEVRNPFLFA